MYSPSPFHPITPSCIKALICAILILLPSGCVEEMSGLNPREKAELEAIFETARKLDEAGRFHEALVRYETILGRHPEFVSTRLNAAMAAYDSGQYQKAADHFEILHKAGPKDWFILRKLIQCYERLGRDEVVRVYRDKLEAIRQQTSDATLLKQYAGLTRDFIPMGSMHLIGYEFFEPKKHGRLWLFKLEDRNKSTVSTFVLEATAFHDAAGKRIFCLTEANRGWLNVWHIGSEGRDYRWARDFTVDCLLGKREPLATKALPPDYLAVAIPENSAPADELPPAPPYSPGPPAK